MANFDSVTAAKRDSVTVGALDRVRAVYSAAKGVQSLLVTWEANHASAIGIS